MPPYLGDITGPLQHHSGRLSRGKLQPHWGQVKDWELACFWCQGVTALQVPGGALGESDLPPKWDLALGGPEQLMVATATVGQPEMILAWP